MTDLVLAYAVVAAMIVVAIYAIVATRILRQRLENEQMAWPYRERLAILAARVRQEGINAPCLVRTTIYYLAERAFDRKFMKKILRGSPPKAGTTLVDRIRDGYGMEYGEMVAEALSSMAVIVLLSDRKYAHELRSVIHKLDHHTHGAYEDARAVREERRREEENPDIRRVRQTIVTQIAADPAVSDLVVPTQNMAIPA